MTVAAIDNFFKNLANNPLSKTKKHNIKYKFIQLIIITIPSQDELDIQ